MKPFEHPADAHAPIELQRTPYFCSGCPHNTSTKVPEGSRAMAGIGCHGMALYDAEPAHRDHLAYGRARASNWIGQAPFTSEQHIFQNLGDGTYTHSGLLALRAAAAAGVNITYKILYNDAVAMTGGQPAEGGLTRRADRASGLRPKAPSAWPSSPTIPANIPAKAIFPPGATVHHRRELDAVQRELREIKGLTVLIYDQTCAAEKRRRRKRGLYPDPPKRVFINDLVCEGCGDCSQASNCVSVQPLETEFGRKRQIDQSNCNKDYSCVEGFCPSFVTVHGGTLKKAADLVGRFRPICSPICRCPTSTQLDAPYNILVTGIGGTGVITIGALLGMAAHLDGKGCSALDFTGLAQKNGAVMSHVRIAPNAGGHCHGSHRFRRRRSDSRLRHGGFGKHCRLSAASTRGVTRAIVNADLQPTASFVHESRHRFRDGRDAGRASRRDRRTAISISSTPPASRRP